MKKIVARLKVALFLATTKIVYSKVDPKVDPIKREKEILLYLESHMQEDILRDVWTAQAVFYSKCYLEGINDVAQEQYRHALNYALYGRAYRLHELFWGSVWFLLLCIHHALRYIVLKDDIARNLWMTEGTEGEDQ